MRKIIFSLIPNKIKVSTCIEFHFEFHGIFLNYFVGEAPYNASNFTSEVFFFFEMSLENRNNNFTFTRI